MVYIPKPMDTAVNKIVRHIHPEDLGEETNKLEKFLYEVLEELTN